jgi:pimeloyl-ACP methyl ester carboxylesterase
MADDVLSGSRTEPQPSLTRAGRRHPRAVVLMLHGGAEHNTEPVGPKSLSWLRSRVMMLQLQGGFRRRGLAVWLLRYRYVGWNRSTGSPSPVPDARWALDEVRATHGDVPVILLGHSMGGRTAAAVADDPAVVGVVAVAPWFPPGEPVRTLRGKALRAAHGHADRITSFEATADFVRRAVADGADATLTDMDDLDHYMVRGLRRWNHFAKDAVLSLLA